MSVLDLFVFSDGAMNANGFTGGGYAIYRGNNLLSTGSVPFGSSAEVHDAEIAAAVIGTQAAISTAEAALSENIYICLDNEAAAITLAEGYKNSSSYEYLTLFSDLKEKWYTRSRGTYWPPTAGNINVRWCPGHSGIEGNEKADTLAKEACEIERCPDIPDITKHALAKIEERYTLARLSYFETHMPQRYRNLGLAAKESIPFTLRMTRKTAF